MFIENHQRSYIVQLRSILLIMRKDFPWFFILFYFFKCTLLVFVGSRMPLRQPGCDSPTRLLQDGNLLLQTFWI